MSGRKSIQLYSCFCEIAMNDIIELKHSAPPWRRTKHCFVWCGPDKVHKEEKIKAAVEFQGWEIGKEPCLEQQK